MFMLEAMASGVPVVQPRLGASSEIVEATGGGLCYEPGNSEEYVQALELLLTDESKWRQMSRVGQQAVSNQFDVSHTAVGLVGLYEQAVKDTWRKDGDA